MEANVLGSWDQKIFSIGHCGSAFFPREHTVLVLVLLFCPGPARPAPHAAVLVLPFCPGPAKLASPGFASPGQNGKTKTAVACRRAGFAGPGQNGKTKTAVGEQALLLNF